MGHEAFVYIWKNITDIKEYIGYHKGDKNDGYICSSLNKQFWIDYENEEKEWKRSIIFEGSSNECLEYEQKLLHSLDLSEDRYYNNGRGATIIFTDEVREKMSLTHTERWENMSEDKKRLRAKRISESKIGIPRSEETKKKLSDYWKGKNFVDRFGEERAKEIGEKISKSNTGQTYHSDEWKAHLSDRLKGNDFGKYQSKETRKVKRQRWIGTKNPNSKKVIDIDNNIVYNTIVEACEASGLSRHTIYNHCNDKVKTPEWKYYGRKE